MIFLGKKDKKKKKKNKKEDEEDDLDKALADLKIEVNVDDDAAAKKKAKKVKIIVIKSHTPCQISAPNRLVRRDFSVVPDSVFLFSENSQIFLWSFLKFFSNF